VPLGLCGTSAATPGLGAIAGRSCITSGRPAQRRGGGRGSGRAGGCRCGTLQYRLPCASISSIPADLGGSAMKRGIGEGSA